MVEKQVRKEYMGEILATLGAKDMSVKADEEREKYDFLVTKESVENVIANDRDEEDVNLGNEILYLRDRQVLEVTERGGDLFLGIKYNQSRPDRISYSHDSIEYPAPEPDWEDTEEPEFEIDQLYSTIAETMTHIGDRIKSGEHEIKPNKMQKFIDKSEFEDSDQALEAVHYTLNLLTESDRLLMDLGDGEMTYIPNSEYLDEFEEFHSYWMENNQPLYELGREFALEDRAELEKEGVKVFSELEQYAG